MKRTRIVLSIAVFALLVSMMFSMNVKPVFAAAEEEIIAGTVVKTDKGIIIEADDGDYLVKGQDLSKMVGKLVEITGVITESDKGDTIEVKSFEEIQE
jgi:hypothetical protein